MKTSRIAAVICAVLSCGDSLSQAATVVPVVHWNFDGNTNDSSSNGNNGTITGSSSYTTGKWGQAIVMNGSSFISDTNAVNLPITGAFSINIWLRVQTFGLRNYLAGFGGTNTQAPTGSLRGLFQDNSRPGLGFWGSNADVNSPTSAYSDDLWHMYTATYDGFSSLKLFIDGTLNQSGNVALSTLNTNTVSVGGLLPPSWTSSNFTGAADDFSIWNGELLSTQVSNLFTTNAIPEPSALILCGLSALSFIFMRKR